VNTANPVLFDNLNLEGCAELFPGRLFTTRMPRDIKKKAAADAFRAKCLSVRLHTVLVLAESEEYLKYAGSDLEEFYRALGLEVIHRPIADFKIPNQPDMILDIKATTSSFLLFSFLFFSLSLPLFNTSLYTFLYHFIFYNFSLLNDFNATLLIQNINKKQF
jgi:hypothetical protein